MDIVISAKESNIRISIGNFRPQKYKHVCNYSRNFRIVALSKLSLLTKEPCVLGKFVLIRELIIFYRMRKSFG